MSSAATLASEMMRLGAFEVVPFLHPQGCRSYLVIEPESKDVAILDVHLDLALEVVRQASEQDWRVRWVIDTHTHADHPSGAGPLAAPLGATRVAHARAAHAGVTHMPDDEEPLALGDAALTVRHAPGHTPDHMVIHGEGALFSGDSLFIGGVARADFLGGDAGRLYDSIHDVMLPLSPETVLFPGHDYAGRVASTLGDEARSNPWLQLEDRDAFVKHLSDNAPPEPANMAALLRFNREGTQLPGVISAADAVALVAQGAAGTIIDVRTPEELEAAHIPGSRHILLDEIPERVDEVRATPAPRLMLCKMGVRASHASAYLSSLGVQGCCVIEGGIVSYMQAGGEVAGGNLEAATGGGGCCAAPPPTST